MIEPLTAAALSEADRIDFYARRYTADKLQLILLHSGRVVLFNMSFEPVALIADPPELLRTILADSLARYAEYCSATELRRKAREVDEALETELEEDGFITVNL